MTNIEFEATFKQINPFDLRKKINECRGKNIHSKFLMKRAAFHLPTPTETEWLRVRQEFNKITLTYKNISRENTIESQKEIELSIDNFEQAILMLQTIGCKQKAYQENYRESWEIDNIIVTIDEWPFLEPFVEIEGKSKEEVIKVAKKLGFSWEDAIFDAVTVQYAEKYGIIAERINNQTPLIVFDMENPFI